MTTCKVCTNVYHSNRVSCPVCGSHNLPTGNFVVDTDTMIVRELVTARGSRDTKLKDWFRVK